MAGLLESVGAGPDGAVLAILQNPLFNAGLAALAAGQAGQSTGQGLLNAAGAASRAQETIFRREARNQRLEEMAEQARLRRLRQEGRSRVRELLPEFTDDPLVKLLAGTPGFEDEIAKAVIQRRFAQPKQTAAVQNALALGLQQGTPEFNEFVREAVLKPGVVINQGQKSLSLSDLQKLRNAAGETPPPGTTMDQAVAGGFKVTTPSEQKLAASSSGALAFVDQLENLGFDKANPLFKDFSGVVGRGKLAASNQAAMLSQSNQSMVLFNDLSQSGLSIIVRSLGEVGTLNEGDVQRIRNALPRLSPLPDKPEIAKRKLDTLRSIIEDVSGRKPSSNKRTVVNVVTTDGKNFVQFADGTWEQK